MSRFNLPINVNSFVVTFRSWAAELRKRDIVTLNPSSVFKNGDIARFDGQEWSPIALSSLLVPIGAPIPWFFSTAPDKHIFLHGQSLSIETYKELFDVYHYAFGGSGDSFQVRDMGGYYLFGVAASGTGSTLRGTFGTKDMTVTMKKHYHGKGDLNVAASGSHTHQVRVASGLGGSTSQLTNPNWTTAGNNAQTGWNSDPSTHTHGSGDFAGSVGRLSGAGGVDGDSDQTLGGSSAQNPPSIACEWITRYTNY